MAGVELLGIGGASAGGNLLMVSSQPDRSGYHVLNGSSVAGPVYVFVKAVSKTTAIDFYIDQIATPVAKERSAPWDLGSSEPRGGEAKPFDVSSLGVGTHAIHYHMTYDGKTVVNNATFTVVAAPGRPAPVLSPSAVSTTRPGSPPPPVVSAKPRDTSYAPVPAAGRATSTPTNLERAGTALPDTDYAIPSGAIFMATSGSDSNSGGLDKPVYTLNRAVSLAPAGGTIVVRGGTYRDAYSGNANGVTKKLTLQAYPHEQVWFDGTDVVAASQFTADGSGHYVTTWNTSSFCMGNYYTRAFASPSKTPKNDQCAYWDSSLDSENPMAVDPQMVFKDGTYVKEVKSLGDLKGDSFYYAQDTASKTGKIYLSFNPSGRYVEVTARPNALVLRGEGSKVLGIGFKRYASNVLGQQTTGAVYSGASGLLFENSAVVRSAGPGLSGNLAQAVVRHSTFVANGANGIVTNGHFRAGTRDDTLIENNLFDGNNAERFDVGCSASCGAAAIKLNHQVGFVIRDNVIDDTGGTAKGAWCDLACSDGVIVKNSMNDNGGNAIQYEVSDKGIIASNLIKGGGGRGISVGSANTLVYNNTMIGLNVALNLYDDSRSLNVDGWTDVGPDTRNLEVANNVVIGSTDMIHCGPPLTRAGKNQAPNTGCDQFFKLLDYNAYFQTTTGGKFRYAFANLGDSKQTLYTSIADFQKAYGLDDHTTGKVSSSAVFAAAARHADAVPDTGTGTTIPSSVAKALGISTVSGLDRGALIYPGSGD